MSRSAGRSGGSPRQRSLDIRDYIIDDGTTANDTAVAAAIAATPAGGTLDFRGVRNAIRVAAPIDLIEQRTYLFDNNAGMWPYRQTSPFPGSIKATAGFSGDSVVRIRENSITGRSAANDTIQVKGLVVDVSAASGNVDGLRVEGLCRDLHFEQVSSCNAKGTGRGFHFLQGAGTAVPRGLRMRHVVAYSAGLYGFRMNGPTDVYCVDMLAVSNGGHGIYWSNSGESYIQGRSVFNTGNGWLFDGTTSSGMTVLCPETDRNTQNGVVISQSGTQPFQIVAPLLRRDGSSSTSANYAGLAITGAAGVAAVPVDVTIAQVVPGVDDGGGGSATPQHAVRATYAQRLTMHGGDLWGISSGFSDGGNNTQVEWDSKTVWSSGAIGAKARLWPTPIAQSFMDMVEQADPAAPAANTGRIYVRDNGSGKTQYCVRFPTGAVQVLATEP